MGNVDCTKTREFWSNIKSPFIIPVSGRFLCGWGGEADEAPSLPSPNSQGGFNSTKPRQPQSLLLGNLIRRTWKGGTGHDLGAGGVRMKMGMGRALRLMVTEGILRVPAGVEPNERDQSPPVG